MLITSRQIISSSSRKVLSTMAEVCLISSPQFKANMMENQKFK